MLHWSHRSSSHYSEQRTWGSTPYRFCWCHVSCFKKSPSSGQQEKHLAKTSRYPFTSRFTLTWIMTKYQHVTPGVPLCDEPYHTSILWFVSSTYNDGRIQKTIKRTNWNFEEMLGPDSSMVMVNSKKNDCVFSIQTSISTPSPPKSLSTAATKQVPRVHALNHSMDISITVGDI